MPPLLLNIVTYKKQTANLTRTLWSSYNQNFLNAVQKNAMDHVISRSVNSKDDFPGRLEWKINTHNRIVEWVYIPRVPECLSLRRNWVPPLPPSHASECVAPLGPNGVREQHSLGGEGVGTQFGRLDRKPGTLYTLWTALLKQKRSDISTFKTVLSLYAPIAVKFFCCLVLEKRLASASACFYENIY